MPEEPDCVAKPRIYDEAQHGIDDVDGLIVAFQENEDLRLGLQAVKHHFEVIKADTHHQS